MRVTLWNLGAAVLWAELHLPFDLPERLLIHSEGQAELGESLASQQAVLLGSP